MPRPFTLDRDFIQEIRDLVPAEPLDEILADYDTWLNEKPRELCRKVVIELLAWQFASPVRWIETQDLLFIEEAAGGLGVERFVEIGVKSAPTVAGLATNTLKLPEYAHSTVEVLNSERDAAVLFATDTDPEPEPTRTRRRCAGGEPPRRAEAAAAGRGAAPAAPPVAPRPDDITFDAADATLALIALSAKMRIDQIEALDSIESITDGASSRRNQLLVDLGSELNLGAIDGAAEADLAGLQGAGHQAGPHLQALRPSAFRCDQRSAAHGARPVRASGPAAIAERVKKTWELGDGWAKHVTVEVALGTREGTSVRGGALGGLHDGALADAGGRRQGHRRRGRCGRGAPRHRRWRCRRPAVAAVAMVDSAALGEFAEQVTGRDGVLASAARLVLGQLGLDDPVSAAESASDAELIDLVTAELGSDWPRLVAPAFDGQARRWCSTTAGPAPARTWSSCGWPTRATSTRTGRDSPSGSRVPATSSPRRPTGGRARPWPRAVTIHASLYGRIAAGAENPGKGRYTDEIAVVTGASKGSIAASVVGAAARRRRHGHRHDVQARRRPAGVLPDALP